MDLLPFKHLIFDFDGTLFSLKLPWQEHFKEPLLKKLYELDPTLEDFKCKRTGEKINESVRRHGEIAWKLDRELLKEFESKYLQGVTEIKVWTDYLRKFHDKHKLYLWTSNSQSTVEPILEEAGLLDYFEQIVAAGSVKLIKPEPDGFYLIFKPGSQKKTDYAMIGDSKADRGAAEAAGITFIPAIEELF